MAILGEIDIIWSKQGARDRPSALRRAQLHGSSSYFASLLYSNIAKFKYILQASSKFRGMVARDSGRPIFVPSSALDTKFAANICRAVKQWKTRENISALGNFSPHHRDAETLWEEKADGLHVF